MDCYFNCINSEMDLVFFFGGFSFSGQSDASVLGSSAWHVADFLVLAIHDFSPVFGGLPLNIVRGGQDVGFKVGQEVVASLTSPIC